MEQTKLFEQALQNTIFGLFTYLQSSLKSEESAKKYISNVLQAHLKEFGSSPVLVATLEEELKIGISKYKDAEEEEAQVLYNEIHAMKTLLDLLNDRRV